MKIQECLTERSLFFRRLLAAYRAGIYSQSHREPQVIRQTRRLHRTTRLSVFPVPFEGKAGMAASEALGSLDSGPSAFLSVPPLSLLNAPPNYTRGFVRAKLIIPRLLTDLI